MRPTLLIYMIFYFYDRNGRGYQGLDSHTEASSGILLSDVYPLHASHDQSEGRKHFRNGVKSLDTECVNYITLGFSILDKNLLS